MLLKTRAAHIPTKNLSALPSPPHPPPQLVIKSYIVNIKHKTWRRFVCWEADMLARTSTCKKEVCMIFEVEISTLPSWSSPFKLSDCHYGQMRLLQSLRLTKICFNAQKTEWGCFQFPKHLPKGPLSATKWAKNVFFCRRVRGVRFKKVHFLGPKGPLFEGPAPPQKNWSWLRAWLLA